MQILAMLVLAFLTVLGGALLLTATIDARIGDNYRTNTQLLYVAEAGIEQARELLRTSPNTASEMLAMAGDDVPLLDDVALKDFSGRVIGTYDVFLRNDVADGMTSSTDTNDVLNLLSIATIGKTRKSIEATVAKPRTWDGLSAVATEISSPVADVGSPGDYRVVIVKGNAELNASAGYGILMVQGDLSVTGNFVWNGLIMVGGTLDGAADAGEVNGAVVTTVPFNSERVHFDPAVIEAANKPLSYAPISIREY